MPSRIVQAADLTLANFIRIGIQTQAALERLKFELIQKTREFFLDKVQISVTGVIRIIGSGRPILIAIELPEFQVDYRLKLLTV